MATTSLYPLASKEDLTRLYVGKSLKDIPAPAAVLDLSRLKDNCSRMLEAREQLGFGWRAHIKTHKTTELTRLQVGTTGPVNIIVSTIIEAEFILPLLLEYKDNGRPVNVYLPNLVVKIRTLTYHKLLYSFPISPNSTSTIDRLSVLAKDLGPRGLSLMIDHPAQLPALEAIYSQSGLAPNIFLKIDMGAHRAGVPPNSETCTSLITSLLTLHSQSKLQFFGLYSHAGQSYSSTSRASALDFLRQEFDALLITATAVHSSPLSTQLSPTVPLPLVLSVGATPTTTAVRNLLLSDESAEDVEVMKEIYALRGTLSTIRDLGCHLEIHAGVYPTLDLQQLATHALPTSGPNAMLSWSSLAFTILADVVSSYPSRGADGKPEVLIGAGCIALGREVCKAYEGWGIVTPWNRDGQTNPETGVESYEGWMVIGVSQEHGVLGWRGKWDSVSGGEQERRMLGVGERVRIWPNHACIAGVGFGWYVIVDSTRKGREDEVVDVWPRWRGW